MQKLLSVGWVLGFIILSSASVYAEGTSNVVEPVYHFTFDSDRIIWAGRWGNNPDITNYQYYAGTRDTNGNAVYTSGRPGYSESGPVYYSGILGGAQPFDGVDDYIRFNVRRQFDSFTISFWMLSEDKSRRQGIVLMREYQGDLSQLTYRRVFFSPGRLEFDAVGQKYSREQINVSSNFLASGSDWEHFAAVYDGRMGQGALYRNGELVTDPQYRGVSNPAYYLHDLRAWIDAIWIGVRIGDTPFQGLLDELKIYDQPLSADEVREEYERVQLQGGTAAKLCGDGLCEMRATVETAYGTRVISELEEGIFHCPEDCAAWLAK